ncbi:MAG: CocE/NonD family hydrolase, partial [Armatimonadetes bacterium]|nr:CocE/NonD family hydrolase [Armatimonadota bacterium]
VFLMGENRWVGLDDWPPPGLEEQRWYLDSDGAANMRHGDGRLSLEMPGKSAADAYTHDPCDPVPTRGGAIYWGLEHAGPVDIRPVLERPDVLYYRSEKLAGPLTVIGEPGLDLQASSDALDTDFVARLCDVYPDGRSINLTEGVIRARLREGIWGEPKLIEPGTVYEFTIGLDATSNVFLAGHQLRLDITSSNFPLWDRNLNTGGDGVTETTWQVARQTIHHDAARPSRVRLPVV